MRALSLLFASALGAHANAVPCVADQIRISLSGATDGTSMGVSWATTNTSTPPGYVGVIAYGPSPTSLRSLSLPADTRNYTMNGVRSPHLHYTKLTGLTPLQRVFYQVQANSGCIGSGILNFTAPPPTGTATYPLGVVGYADMGISHSANTAAFLSDGAVAGDFHLVIHAGDISYADNRGDTDRDGGYDNVQNTYYNEISPYAALIPTMFSSGNHEAYSGDQPSFLAYRERVAPTMPGTATSGSPYWHSFDYGRVHFVAFDIDQPWAAGSAQHAWVAADLAAVDRAATPWVVAYQHFPLMCSNKFWCLDGSGDAQAFRAVYEPLFNAPATRVHVFLSGHVHAAEVMFPLATGAQVPYQTNFTGLKTVLQVMAGFPGDEEVCCNDWAVPTPAYSAWRVDDVASDGGASGGGADWGASESWKCVLLPRPLVHAGTFGFSRFTFKSDTALTLEASGPVAGSRAAAVRCVSGAGDFAPLLTAPSALDRRARSSSAA